MATLQLFFQSMGTGGSPTGPDPENRVGDQDTESPGRSVSSRLQVPGEKGHCRARTRPPWWTSRGIFPSKYPLIASAEMSNTAATPLIVSLSPSRSNITRFRPWSPIATSNHLDRAEKIPNVAQTTGTVDVFDPRSGISEPTSRRAFACPNLHEWWTQPAQVR